VSARAAPARIRPATAGDATRIAAIYGHWVRTSVATFDETPPDAGALAEKVAAVTRAGLPFLVAEAGGVVAAYAHLAPWRARPAYAATAEDSVYVDPAARGRGHGRALLERLLADGAAAGVREVVAVIAVTDDRAPVTLHRALGFREAGLLKRVGHKHGRRLDTLLMQRSLAR
jgi:phosphinothricin acetyltransferase